MEAVAIIGCIAAVVSAYRDGGAIVDKIKNKRLARQAPPPTRLLEESLARGPKAVEEAKENGIERFGPRYAAGDELALGSLKDILIDLQGSLLRHLRQAQEDDNMTDFTTLVDASDIGRIRTVTVLNELYMRVAMSATIAPNSFGDMGTFTNSQIGTSNGHITPNPILPVLTNTAHGQGDSNIAQQISREQASPGCQEVRTTQAPSRLSPRPGFFDRFRRKSSSEEGTSAKTSVRSPRIRSKYEVASQEKRSQKILPSPPDHPVPPHRPYRHNPPYSLHHPRIPNPPPLRPLQLLLQLRPPKTRHIHRAKIPRQFPIPAPPPLHKLKSSIPVTELESGQMS